MHPPLLQVLRQLAQLLVQYAREAGYLPRWVWSGSSVVRQRPANYGGQTQSQGNGSAKLGLTAMTTYLETALTIPESDSRLEEELQTTSA